MIPKLTTIPKHREFESSYKGFVCPYCGTVYSIPIYVKMELDGDMKCMSCGKEWKKEE
jgi:uncharacterized Zn-finger protein